MKKMNSVNGLKILDIEFNSLFRGSWKRNKLSLSKNFIGTKNILYQVLKTTRKQNIYDKIIVRE